MINDQITKVVDVSGTAVNVILGFVPQAVILYNGTTQVTWFKEMGDDKGKKIKDAAGVSDIASNGISSYAGEYEGIGITVKDADLLNTGKLYILAIH